MNMGMGMAMHSSTGSGLRMALFWAEQWYGCEVRIFKGGWGVFLVE